MTQSLTTMAFAELIGSAECEGNQQRRSDDGVSRRHSAVATIVFTRFCTSIVTTRFVRPKPSIRSEHPVKPSGNWPEFLSPRKMCFARKGSPPLAAAGCCKSTFRPMTPTPSRSFDRPMPS